MKKYITTTKDTCWTDCLACLLEVKPEKVPKFVKLYKNKYMDFTRDWLKVNFNKGLVYIPSRQFMETGGLRNNPPMGPSGYSIAHLSMVDDRAMHVAVAFNGGIIFDNGNSREDEYGTIEGYFVLYDLEAKKAEWVQKGKDKKKKKKKKEGKKRKKG